MNETKKGAIIHVETPDSENFTVSVESTGGGSWGVWPT